MLKPWVVPQRPAEILLGLSATPVGLSKLECEPSVSSLKKDLKPSCPEACGCGAVAVAGLRWVVPWYWGLQHVLKPWLSHSSQALLSGQKVQAQLHCQFRVVTKEAEALETQSGCCTFVCVAHTD